jgi:hypothetical protein
MMSTMRMIAASIQPRKNPASAPSTEPTATPMVTDMTAMPSVNREPNTIRLKTSWPWMFVPNQCSAPGGR